MSAQPVEVLRPVGPDGIEILPFDATESDWLTLRNSGVGASEVAAVLAESFYDSPYSLWARKTGRVLPEQQTSVQKRGHRFEQAIADTFAEHHPEYQVRRVGLVRHHENGWELATPDRELFTNNQGAGLLELKTAGFGKSTEWGEEGTDDVPVGYGLQSQWQMAVTGYSYVWVPVLFSLDDYREYLVRRDDDVITYLRERVFNFWHTHVLPDDPPPVDGHDATTKAMRAQPTFEGSVELSPDAAELCAQYWAAHRDVDEAQARKDLAGNQLRDMLAGAQVGLLDGKQWVSNKLQKGRSGFDLERFTADHPDLAAQYITRGASFPVLRPKKVS